MELQLELVMAIRIPFLIMQLILGMEQDLLILMVMHAMQVLITVMVIFIRMVL